MTDIHQQLKDELTRLRLAGRRPCRISVTSEQLALIEAREDEARRYYDPAPAAHPDRPTFTGVPIYPELERGPAEVLCDERAGHPSRFALADA